MPSTLSKPTIILGSTTAIFILWAFWYDHYRRNKPDYKSNLVKKRKQQLIEKREANDPLSYIKKIPLPKNCTDPLELQKYQMEHLTKGELKLANPATSDNGCAHIAMGLGFMDGRRSAMVLQQLTMTLPRDVVEKIRFYLRTAQARFESQVLQSIMNKNKKLNNQPVLQKITPKNNQEPEDVDSIDGDDEKIVLKDEQQLPSIKGEKKESKNDKENDENESKQHANKNDSKAGNDSDAEFSELPMNDSDAEVEEEMSVNKNEKDPEKLGNINEEGDNIQASEK